MSLRQWNIIHALAMSAGLAVFHFTGQWWPVLLIAILSVILLWTSQWYTISHYKPFGGYGNLVTLLRYLLIILIISLSGLWNIRFIGVLFILPVALDGLDGFLARRMNQLSKLGALLDPESDSLFVALAGLLLYSRHIAGAWLLPAVYMRYIFVLVVTLMGMNGIAEKRLRFGPAIAVLMFISLIVVCIFPSLPSKILLGVAAVMVILSFGFSFIGILSSRKAL
jgi:phosphatidylglycerophosphate synthase